MPRSSRWAASSCQHSSTRAPRRSRSGRTASRAATVASGPHGGCVACASVGRRGVAGGDVDPTASDPFERVLAAAAACDLSAARPPDGGIVAVWGQPAIDDRQPPKSPARRGQRKHRQDAAIAALGRPGLRRGLLRRRRPRGGSTARTLRARDHAARRFPQPTTTMLFGSEIRPAGCPGVGTAGEQGRRSQRLPPWRPPRPSVLSAAAAPSVVQLLSHYARRRRAEPGAHQKGAQ